MKKIITKVLALMLALMLSVSCAVAASAASDVTIGRVEIPAATVENMEEAARTNPAAFPLELSASLAGTMASFLNPISVGIDVGILAGESQNTQPDSK